MKNVLLKKIKNEEGAIALATLAFMIGAGMTILIMLWGIANITGAYNALYAANQAASYAAVTRVGELDSGAVDEQLPFVCNQRIQEDDTTCILDPAEPNDAVSVASEVMEASLAEGTPGTFGLVYNSDNSGTVKLVDQNYENKGRPVIKAYQIPYTPAAAEEITGGTCDPPPGQDWQSGNTPDAPSMVCWKLSEFGVDFPAQFENGVVTRATATMPLLPGCTNLELCPDIDIQVASAAVQNRPQAPCTYSEYSSYGSNSPSGGEQVDCAYLAPPKNIRRPYITGRTRVGETLRANRGTWQGSNLNFTYTWLRCSRQAVNCQSTGVAGNSRTTYRVKNADKNHKIILQVRAQNSEGSQRVRSRASALIRAR